MFTIRAFDQLGNSAAIREEVALETYRIWWLSANFVQRVELDATDHQRGDGLGFDERDRPAVPRDTTAKIGADNDQRLDGE